MTTFLLTATEFIRSLFWHVYQSVSSIKFYQNVFLNYKGSGTKYILNLAIISSFFSCLILLNHTNNIIYYLENNNAHLKSSNIEYILQQMPTLDYDGNSIVFGPENEPIIINNIQGVSLLAIDPHNKLNSTLRAKIPIMMHKEQLNINILDQQGKIINSMTIKYNYVFGDQPQTLTKEFIKNSLLQIFSKSSQFIILAIFPLLTMFMFFQVFWENLLLFIIILLFIKISKTDKTFRDGVRVVLFSSSFYVLFQFLFLVVSSEISFIIWIIKAWSSFLMITGVIKATPKFTIIEK